MLLSSEANIFHKISGEAVPFGIDSGLSYGRPLIVLIDARAYVVLPKNPREYFSPSNVAISSNGHNEFIIRFSNRIFTSLQSSGNVIDELKTMCGVNLDITESYKIISTSIGEHLKKRIENRYGIKNDFKYFTIASLKSNAPSSNVIGSVYSLAQRPIPLISVSFLRKYDNTDQQSRTMAAQMNPLLQQCVKRILVGNIVVCNPCSEKAKSSFSLLLPSMASMNEHLKYKVLDATPNLRQGLTKEDHASFIYQILPSTRIILENESIDFRMSDTPTKVPTDNMILNTIQAVRRCSTLNHSSSHQANFNFDIPRAFFLSGPAGVGKTYQIKTAVDILNDQAQSESIKLVSLRGSELLSLGPNEGEAAIQLEYIFENAVKFSQKDQSCISLVFMDECDALLSSDIIGATLGSLLDKVSNLNPIDIPNQESSGWKRLIIIAATNRIDAIPSYLRRPGRFDREICVSSPTAQARYKILKSILSEIGAFIANEEEKQQELMHIADLTVGYVAADLSSLVRRALLLSISAGQSEQSHVISTKHLQQAMQDVGASALRDTSASAPPATTWDDIAGDAGGAKVSIWNFVMCCVSMDIHL